VLQCVALWYIVLKCNVISNSPRAREEIIWGLVYCTYLCVCTYISESLQCVAVCYNVLQCVAVCCSMLQCVAVLCSVLQCVAVCHIVAVPGENSLTASVKNAVCCSVVQCVAMHCSVLQCVT